MNYVIDGRTHSEVVADIVMRGLLGAAATTATYSSKAFGEIDLTQACGNLEKQIDASKAGNMGIADELLVGHARTLDVMFHELARRAALNFGEYPETAERYMRLAFKAQSQCRASLESLAIIKTPRSVAFVHQANYAQGHQQICNGQPRTIENDFPQVKQLEVSDGNGKWLDERATHSPIESDSALAAVAPVDRSKDRRR